MYNRIRGHPLPQDTQETPKKKDLPFKILNIFKNCIYFSCLLLSLFSPRMHFNGFNVNSSPWKCNMHPTAQLWWHLHVCLKVTEEWFLVFGENRHSESNNIWALYENNRKSEQFIFATLKASDGAVYTLFVLESDKRACGFRTRPSIGAAFPSTPRASLMWKLFGNGRQF